jgi:hypothetical protein
MQSSSSGGEPPSDPVTTTILANIDVTTTALQDVFVVTGIAHFTPETPSGTARKDALETPRMLAFMVVL